MRDRIHAQQRACAKSRDVTRRKHNGAAKGPRRFFLSFTRTHVHVSAHSLKNKTTYLYPWGRSRELTSTPMKLASFLSATERFWSSLVS